MRRRLVRLLLILIVSCTPAFAQEPKIAFRVLVIGDVLASGLGAGLRRAGPAAGLALDVETRFKEDSGLARPEIYDWNQALPRILEARDFDVAVVMVGANDVQPIRSAGGLIPFETGPWRAAYGENVGRLIGTLKGAGITVIWVGLPPMAAGTYDRSIRLVAAEQQARAEADGAIYLDTRAVFGTADGSYRDSGPDDAGVTRLLRTRDGVRFLRPGNTVLAKLVATAIKKGTALKPVDAPETVSSGPAFGQDAPEGGDNILRPELPNTEEVTSANADAEEGPGEPVKEPAKQRPEPALGSAAERLFIDGLAADPPVGRFDDARAAP